MVNGKYLDGKSVSSQPTATGVNWQRSRALEAKSWRKDRQALGGLPRNEPNTLARQVQVSQSIELGTSSKMRNLDYHLDGSRRRRMEVNNGAPVRGNGLDSSQVGDVFSSSQRSGEDLAPCGWTP